MLRAIQTFNYSKIKYQLYMYTPFESIELTTSKDENLVNWSSLPNHFLCK